MRLKQIVLAVCCLFPMIAWGALDRISLQLLWKHQFQFAGYYLAKEKGFYRDAGLDVEIREFSNEVDLVGEVVSGTTDFAIGRSSLIIDRAKGRPIVALMAAFQQSPLMLISKKESGIDTPENLRGRRVMLTQDAEQVAEVLAMMLRVGIFEGDFQRQPHSFNLEDLMQGKTDAYGAYISNEPFQMQQRGIPYQVLHPRDYGFDMYSDILFTSEQYLDANPDKVKAFLHASMRGWEYAFEHIEESAQLIHRAYNTQSRSLAALRYEGEVLKQLAYAGVSQFGELDLNRFQQMANIYLITGALDSAVDLKRFVYTPPPLASGIQLSQAQMYYLLHRATLKLCVASDNMPYEGVAQGRHQGVVSGYLEVIAEMLEIDFELVSQSSARQSLQALEAGSCDLVAGVMQTLSRSRHFAFSRPYLSVPVSLVRRQGDDAFDLNRGPYAVQQGTAFVEIIGNRYPRAEIVEVASLEQGFKLLADNRVRGVAAPEDAIERALRDGLGTDVEVTAELNDSWDISMASTSANAPLVEIINRGITNLSAQDHNSIHSRWIQEPEPEVFDTKLFWQALALLLLVLAFLGYRYKVVSGYNRRLQQLASYDQLTGIDNRYSIGSKLDNQIGIANRYGRKLSIIFFDIDHFKQINDTYGHMAGDEILAAVARLVQENIRQADIFGRWGGDEFMLLLPEQNGKQAQQDAEKLRQLLAGHRDSRGQQISCSFGVSEFQPGMSEYDLVSSADRALYKAKAQGRNRVVMAEPEAVARPASDPGLDARLSSDPP